MGTAAGMLAAARKSLGTSGRPNYITRDYATRHGDVFLSEPWCDMSITYWARQSGNTAAVLPGGDRAFTVWHAEDFLKAKRWYKGTTGNVNRARPGDIVFFDWGASKSLGAIDHVGVIEKALGGGRVQTIEGNTGDQCLRRVRSSAVIAGFGRPNYDKAPTPAPSSSTWTEELVKQLPELKRGASGEDVESLQGLLVARHHPEVEVDGSFGGVTDKAVRAVQRWGGVKDDGVVGAATWPVLLRVR